MEIESEHFMYGLARTYAAFEETAGRQASLLEKETQDSFEEMSRIEKDKFGKIQELSQTMRSEKKWGTISSIAQTAATGTSLAIGALSLAKGKPTMASMLMLASGVTSVAGKVLQYTGVFNKMASWMTRSKEMEDVIASRLEIGTQCTAIGLGLIGGAAAALQSSVVKDSIAKTWPWASSALGFGPRTIEFKKSLVERQSAHINAFLQRSESLINQIYQRIHQTGKDAERLFHTVGEICESLKAAIYTQQMRI